MTTSSSSVKARIQAISIGLLIDPDQPMVYLQTDAPLYYYSFTDAAIAMELGCDVISEKPMTIDQPETTKGNLNITEATKAIAIPLPAPIVP